MYALLPRVLVATMLPLQRAMDARSMEIVENKARLNSSDIISLLNLACCKFPPCKSSAHS